jgi:DNA-binding transcriptional ArsR family regulator
MTRSLPCCPVKSPLVKHKALPPELVEKLESTYQVLASGTRIRILHAICREHELSVQEIAKRLGMKIAAISNQLRLMAAMGVVGSRQEGNRVIYRMVDPCVAELLDKGACLAIDAEKRSRGR